MLNSGYCGPKWELQDNDLIQFGLLSGPNIFSFQQNRVKASLEGFFFFKLRTKTCCSVTEPKAEKS